MTADITLTKHWLDGSDNLTDTETAKPVIVLKVFCEGVEETELRQIVQIDTEESFYTSARRVASLTYSSGPYDVSTASSFVIDNKPTIIDVSDGSAGRTERWVVKKNWNKEWQWEQIY